MRPLNKKEIYQSKNYKCGYQNVSSRIFVSPAYLATIQQYHERQVDQPEDIGRQVHVGMEDEDTDPGNCFRN